MMMKMKCYLLPRNKIGRICRIDRPHQLYRRIARHLDRVSPDGTTAGAVADALGITVAAVLAAVSGGGETGPWLYLQVLDGHPAAEWLVGVDHG